MILDRFVKDPEKRHRFQHFVFGFIILIHAYEKFESGHGPYLLFIFAGIIFLTLAFFYHFLERKFPWIDGTFLLIEGTLSLVVAFDYFHMGKKGVPSMYVLAALLQYFMAWKKSQRGIARNVARTKNI